MCQAPLHPLCPLLPILPNLLKAWTPTTTVNGVYWYQFVPSIKPNFGCWCIYDPSDATFFVNMMLDCNDIPIKYVSGSIASTLSTSADFAKSVEGMDTNYNGEWCLLVPICTIHKTKLWLDGMVEKLKVCMAIRGDRDKDAHESIKLTLWVLTCKHSWIGLYILCFQSNLQNIFQIWLNGLAFHCYCTNLHME
jgi:hypothetical protein